MRGVVALGLVALVAAAPADWTRTVTKAPNGAYVLGNPAAKVRVVEYLSYTCNHCATYAGASSGPLKANYIAKGTTSVEFRNAVRDRLDFAAALAARCGGPPRFFAHSEAIFAAQAGLMAKAATAIPLPETAPINDQIKAIARDSGLGALMAKRGVTPAALNACLTDKPSQDAVLGMTNEAWRERGIPGTPSFLINGTLAQPGGWAQLEPQLRTALAAR